MKSFIILILLFPLLLFGQDMAIETDCSEDNLSMNSITFSNQDGEAYANNLGQPSISPSKIMMDMLDKMVVEFDPSAGIVGEANGQGINNGIIVLTCSEIMTSEISVGSGMPISSDKINTFDMSLTKYVDIHSARFRSLLISETVIPYIEVNYLREFTTGYSLEQIIRFEDCIISSCNSGGSNGEDKFTENITFNYARACYRSFELEDFTGATLFQSDACIDNTISDQSTCTCGSF